MSTKIVSKPAAVSDTAKLNVTSPVLQTEPVESSTAVDSSNLITYKSRQQYNLEISKINADTNQPRKEFDEKDLQELVESIKRHGVLQPVLFTSKDGKLVLVAGERRYRASKLAEIDKIPAIYIDGDDNAEIALVENLLRVDLTPIEEAEALERLKVEKNYTNVQLADVIGKAQSTISEILTLNDLPDNFRNKHRGDRNVSRRRMLELAKADPKEIEKLYNKLLKNATRDELRAGRVPRKKAKLETALKKSIEGLTTMLGKVNLGEIDAVTSQSLVEELEKLASDIKNKINNFKLLSEDLRRAEYDSNRILTLELCR